MTCYGAYMETNADTTTPLYTFDDVRVAKFESPEDATEALIAVLENKGQNHLLQVVPGGFNNEVTFTKRHTARMAKVEVHGYALSEVGRGDTISDCISIVFIDGDRLQRDGFVTFKNTANEDMVIGVVRGYLTAD